MKVSAVRFSVEIKITQIHILCYIYHITIVYPDKTEIMLNIRLAAAWRMVSYPKKNFFYLNLIVSAEYDVFLLDFWLNL
jgi:hypothetical protein